MARAASREARDANVFKRGRLLRNAEQVAGEQSEKLRGAVPWLEDTDIPSDWDQANRFRMRATVAKALEHNVRTSDGMNWNLQDLVYEALSEEWRKRDGEDDDPWENHGPDGYQPPSYEPVNPERRTAQTPSDGLI